ncbi:hypothetical protein [Micromonospora sp. NBC_01813]|uniref:hypothetical protein n=1 Tax=Micromonospora sp. NBC_01813 TaxID=2975988 RepID=UPI002DD9E8E6|nr:hypothetical protein [Micromonospora sp. NBC_01813]WSA09516.1 hypothetical protein OG958_01410 [Micromonospora sp. NBC_01813]
MTSWSTVTRYAMSRSALGGGLAAGLAVGTVIGVPTGGPARPTPADPPARFVTSQPDLGEVLLSPAELPPGYRLVGRDTALADAPSRAGGDRCRHLFERPWAAAIDGRAADGPVVADQVVADQVVAEYRATDGAAIRQSLTLLDSADADLLAAAPRSCGGFPATLDDGSAVTVRVHRGEQLPTGAGDVAWSLLLSVTDPTAADAPPLSGYLAVARHGRLLATVRHLGPIGTVAPADATALLASAVGKVDPAAPLLRPPTGDPTG